jgi:DNA polymerase-3 subunit gamma/tau
VAADGSMRDALSLLDQAISYGAGRVAEPEVRAMLGSIDRGRMHDLLERVAADDAAGVLRVVDELAQDGSDFDGVLADLVGALQRVAVAQLAPQALGDDVADRERVLALAAALSPEDIQLLYQIALHGRRDLPLNPDARAGFEMTVLRMLAFRPQTEPVAERPTGARQRPVVPPPAPPGVPPEQPDPLAVGAGADGGVREWRAVVESLEVVGLTREMALNSVLVRSDGDTLHVQLAPEHAQVRSEKREAQLREALARHYGRPVRLVVSAGGAGLETPAQDRRRELESRQRAAREVLEQDPTVLGLRQVLDASVVEDSVLPQP